MSKDNGSGESLRLDFVSKLNYSDKVSYIKSKAYYDISLLIIRYKAGNSEQGEPVIGSLVEFSSFNSFGPLVDAPKLRSHST